MSNNTDVVIGQLIRCVGAIALFAFAAFLAWTHHSAWAWGSVVMLGAFILPECIEIVTKPQMDKP